MRLTSAGVLPISSTIEHEFVHVKIISGETLARGRASRGRAHGQPRLRLLTGDNAGVTRERWAGARTGGSLEQGTLDVAGVSRSYWLARATGEPPPGGPPPLLMVLHGSGTTGRDAATVITSLAARGPAAGVTVVFPDGWEGVWHTARAPPAARPAGRRAGRPAGAS